MEITPDRESFIRTVSVASRGAPMEGLIELVAASLVRHGIECPAGDSNAAQWTRPTEPISPTVLPDHSFRKKPEAGLAT